MLGFDGDAPARGLRCKRRPRRRQTGASPRTRRRPSRRHRAQPAGRPARLNANDDLHGNHAALPPRKMPRTSRARYVSADGPSALSSGPRRNAHYVARRTVVRVPQACGGIGERDPGPRQMAEEHPGHRTADLRRPIIRREHTGGGSAGKLPGHFYQPRRRLLFARPTAMGHHRFGANYRVCPAARRSPAGTPDATEHACPPGGLPPLSGDRCPRCRQGLTEVSLRQRVPFQRSISVSRPAWPTAMQRRGAGQDTSLKPRP
jgi:hypothetical protein